MDIVINPSLPEPIYSQIYSQISQEILNGTLSAGERLPPIRTIANELRISVIPVKMAWESLEKNGFISTEIGRGTFVKAMDKNEVDMRRRKDAESLAEDTCKRAKAMNISKAELLDLIEKCY